jgi:serine/threonine protein kinase
MPYLPLGNLEDLHGESPITEEENVGLLFQALGALKYLHARGVAHRDLKPENILVESRSPLSIKLADFGLANDKPDLETLCGTQLYTAPEVLLGGKVLSLGRPVVARSDHIPVCVWASSSDQAETWAAQGLAISIGGMGPRLVPSRC